MAALHKSAHTLHCSDIHTSARPLAAPKIPQQNISLHLCYVACAIIISHTLQHKSKSVIESMFFYFLAVSCMSMLPGDPVKGKAALPCWSVRGPQQTSLSLPYYCLSTRVVPLHVPHPPSPCSSLQPCAHTDTHKMLLGEGWAAVCLVTTYTFTLTFVQMQRWVRYNLKTAVYSHIPCALLAAQMPPHTHSHTHPVPCCGGAKATFSTTDWINWHQGGGLEGLYSPVIKNCTTCCNVDIEMRFPYEWRFCAHVCVGGFLAHTCTLAKRCFLHENHIYNSKIQEW